MKQWDPTASLLSLVILLNFDVRDVHTYLYVLRIGICMFLSKNS